MINTTIVCDICGDEDEFEGLDIKRAEKEYVKEGGSVATKKKHLCRECTWKTTHNYFAIDISFKRKGDFQVLAVVHDMYCFKNCSIYLGPHTTKLKVDISIRRLEKSVYDTLTAFGIPELNMEPYHVIRFDHYIFSNRLDAGLEGWDGITFNHETFRRIDRVLDASDAVRGLLFGERPSLKAGESP